MKMASLLCTVLIIALTALAGMAQAQTTKPNILFIVSDDTGWGDLGPYGGGEGRGMPLRTAGFTCRLASASVDKLDLARAPTLVEE